VDVLAGLGLLGGLGAMARFLLDGAVASAVGRDLPYGTLTVNLLGSFVLGVLAGLALDADAHRLAATGLLGSFTTFSTWALESHRLGEDGRLRLGIANFGISLALGVALAWAGRHLGAAL
jgi:CrcB protein